MRQYPIIIFSSLVFLVSLFLFKVIFPALLITTAFVVLSILFGKFWHFKKTPALLLFIKSSTNLIISIILALSVFALIYFPCEFFVTEVWFWIPKIPALTAVSFLIFLVFVFNLIDWGKLVKIKFAWLLMLEVLVLVAVSVFVYRDFHQEKLLRERLPKIYRVSRPWAIQEQEVRVQGVNFFPSFKQGKVVVDGQEMLIRFWSETLIIAEQQVPTKFGQMNLSVVRKDGVASNSFPFEIRDPATLINF